MFDLQLPFEIRNPFIPRKAPPVNILHKGGRALLGLATHGATAAATAAAIGLLVWKLRRDAQCDTLRAARERVARLDTTIAQGSTYEPSIRDCVEGESHDIVVEEDEIEDGAVDGDVDESPPGIARRGPARRRILKRKKMVHQVYEDAHGTVSGPFLGDVIAQARNIYNGGPSDSYHRQLARSFMVRLMTNAHMRPFHINQYIDRMVCCVFRNTVIQAEAALDWEALRVLGDVHDTYPH